MTITIGGTAFLILNLLAFALVYLADREFKHSIDEEGYYRRTRRMIKLERTILLLATIGGWYATSLGCLMTGYKERCPESRFYQGLKKWRWGSILLTVLVIGYLYMRHKALWS